MVYWVVYNMAKKGFWKFMVGEEGVASFARSFLTYLAVALGFFLVNFLAFKLFN